MNYYVQSHILFHIKLLQKIFSGEPVIWEQNDLGSTGYYHDKKTLIDEQGNKLKYKDTDEDLIPAYAKIVQTTPISHSPQEVIELLIRSRI